MQKKTIDQDRLWSPLRACLARQMSWLWLILSFLLLIPSQPLAGQPLSSAAEIDYAPFSLVDNKGRPDGFSVELLRAAMNAMGREVTFRTGPWPDVRKLLEAGEIQALPLVGRTPEREALFDFTFPYMSLHGAIVVRNDNDDINSLEDLRGRQVAVMRGDNAEEFLLREDRGIKYVATASFEDAIQQLSAGHHDAVVLQRLVALRLIQKTDPKNLRIVDTPIEGFRQDFCFAVKEGDRDTLALLNEGLALVMADGTYRSLHSKWFAALQLPVKRKILVGGDFNYPPYEFLDERGYPTGLATELTQAIAREMDLDVEIRLGPWPEVVKNLEEGNIDGVQGMFYLPERDLKFDFSQSYISNHYVAATRTGEIPPPEQLGDIKGLRIAVQDGDAIHTVLQRHGLADQLTLVQSQEEVLQAVIEGTADCALVVRDSALYQLENHDWVGLQLGRRPIYTAEYGYAVPHGNNALLTEFSEGLKILHHNGEYRRIYQKWMKRYASEPSSMVEVLRYSAIFLVPLLLAFLAVFIWSWLLRRQVARKTAQLAGSEAKYRSFFENSLDATLLTSTDGRIFSANAAACQLFARSEDEIIRSGREGLVDSRDPRLTVILSEREQHGKAKGELTLIRKGGERFEGEVTSAVFHSDFDQPRTSMIIRDVSERKRTETSLRESQKRYHGLFESIRDAILVVDLEQNVVECNQAFVELFDYSRKEVLERKPEQVQECAKAFQDLGRALKHNLEDPYLFYTANYRKKNGELFPGETSICYLSDDQGNITEVIGLIRDISRRVQAEEDRDRANSRLRQAQKLEAIGRLAGGVAHDFNNMLNVIIGYTQMALARPETQEGLSADLQEVLKAAQRSTKITRQLLTFARKQNTKPKALGLNEAVENMIKMLRHLIGEDIHLLWQPGQIESTVKIDPTQLDQILANLCVNARDAIASNGSITIQTARTSFKEEECTTSSGLLPGDFILLSVRDDGCGMGKDVLENIFEPFFTTKPPSEGTGLGLATVYGIVRQGHGFIKVNSEPGSGTTINIYLPHHSREIDEAFTEIPS